MTTNKNKKCSYINGVTFVKLQCDGRQVIITDMKFIGNVSNYGFTNKNKCIIAFKCLFQSVCDIFKEPLKLDLATSRRQKRCLYVRNTNISKSEIC